MSERNAEQGAQTLKRFLPATEDHPAVYKTAHGSLVAGREWDARYQEQSAATTVQSPEEGQDTGCDDDQIDPAVVETLRKRIDASGLTTEQFIKAFNDLTPEQIRAHRQSAIDNSSGLPQINAPSCWPIRSPLEAVEERLELIRRETMTVGTDFGIPHVARLAEEALAYLRDAPTCAPVQECAARTALRKLHAAVKTVPEMNYQRFDQLGIEVNAALSEPGSCAGLREERDVFSRLAAAAGMERDRLREENEQWRRAFAHALMRGMEHAFQYDINGKSINVRAQEWFDREQASLRSQLAAAKSDQDRFMQAAAESGYTSKAQDAFLQVAQAVIMDASNRKLELAAANERAEKLAVDATEVSFELHRNWVGTALEKLDKAIREYRDGKEQSSPC